MPRSNALVATVGLFVSHWIWLRGLRFRARRHRRGGSFVRSGTPLGTGASNGTGLVGGGAAQNGHAAVTGMNCAMVQQPLAKLPPDILIIVGRLRLDEQRHQRTSCGNNGCGATSKWAQHDPGDQHGRVRRRTRP